MNPLALLGTLLVALLAGGCGGAMNVVAEGGDSRLMLRGNDPVAYFTEGKPVPGLASLKTEHQGHTYRFSTEDNYRRFITGPERFVPEFGGFCANAMVYAVPAAAGGGTFKIIDGRLHLFSDARARLYFEMDQERNLQRARHYWATEVKDANWRIQAWKRLVFRVPHYKTDSELAEEYDRRFGRKPG